jgi:ABC-type nickel/cobalt efflux system permease component RcnA
MTILLALVLVALVGATAYVLVKGVVGMAQQKDITGQRSQQLMRQRVLLQAAAIFVAVLLLLMASGKH